MIMGVRRLELAARQRLKRAGEGRGINVNFWIIRKKAKAIKIGSRGIMTKTEVIIQVASY